MKIEMETGKITIVVNGRKETYSEKELVEKLEKLNKSKEESEKKQKIQLIQFARKPTEGKLLKVNPKDIIAKEKIFSQKSHSALCRYQAKSGNKISTLTRIIESIQEVKRNFNEYGEEFYLLIPKPEWIYENRIYAYKENEIIYTDFIKLAKFAQVVGEGISNWVTEPLGWAQRILNGESLEDICDNPDTIEYQRLVIWKSEVGTVGGKQNPASLLILNSALSMYRFNGILPSIVIRPKCYPLFF